MFTAKVRQLSYLLRQGLQDLRSAGIPAGIAVMSIACSMLLLCLYFMALSNLSKALDSASNLQVVVYLRDNLTREQTGRLQQVLASITEISRVRYVSKAMALEEFRNSLGRDARLLDGLDTNPLPASFELFLDPALKEPARLKSLMKYLSRQPEVESIQGGVEWVERLSSLVSVSRLVLSLLGAILAIISLFITASTIHLTIDRRREEISIMRLIGASEWYIRLPFLFEGMFEGFLGGGLAIAISAAVYHAFCWKVSPLVNLIFGASAITFLELEKVILVLVLGSVIGGFGAVVSLSLRSA
ncbi:MAG: permease-like cell division protein FtsX [bacterium]